MTNLHQELIRLHGIHHVLHEALPIVRACPEVVAVWAENTHRDEWEQRYELANGSSIYRVGNPEQFTHVLRNLDPSHRATSRPGAVRFWREEVFSWRYKLDTLRATLAVENTAMAWFRAGSGPRYLGGTAGIAVLENVTLGDGVDRDAITRGFWLPREFLVFGDEPAPLPYEQDILSSAWMCDACGCAGPCRDGAVRPIAGIHYASCWSCGPLDNESFIANARIARKRSTHRPETGQPRQVARFDTENGQVVFVDGVRQEDAPLFAEPIDPTIEYRITKRIDSRKAKVSTLLEEMKRPVASVRSSLERKS